MAETERQKEIDFHIHDDPRFPIRLLHKAFWMLENHGYDSFRRFTNSVNMPMQDAERVLNKHGYNTDSKLKAKIDAMIEKIKEKMGVQLSIN
jgi:predicted glycosyltransferase